MFARGNHEDCSRAGLGWSRYLAPAVSHVCRDHEPAVVTTFDDLRIANVGPHIAAIVAGHIHMFAAIPFSGAPPTLLVGTGGDTLARRFSEVTAVPHAVGEARFGYAIFDRTADGWTISERDPDGSEHRRCVLRNRTVHC